MRCTSSLKRCPPHQVGRIHHTKLRECPPHQVARKRPMRPMRQSDQCDQRECPPHQVARKRPMRCTSSLKRCPPHQVGRIPLSAFPNGTTRVFPKCLSQTAQHVSFPSAFLNGTTFPKGTTCRLVFYTVPC